MELIQCSYIAKKHLNQPICKFIISASSLKNISQAYKKTAAINLVFCSVEQFLHLTQS
jgi:hypothetical protein